LYVTDFFDYPHDEGIKKTAYNLYLNLSKKYSIKVVCKEGFKEDKIHPVQTNRLYLSFKIHKLIRSFKPHVIIYFPFASGTFASYLRLKILNIFSPKSKTIFIALQNKSLKHVFRLLSLMMRPDISLTPSSGQFKYWNRLGFKSKILPLYTDVDLFKPVSVKEKTELRKKYGLPIDKYVISHMGHLNHNRNLFSLIPLKEAGNFVIICGSSSTPKDSIGPKSIKEELIANQIKVYDGFLDHIEEIYQLSDLYIFPVVTKNASISLPLSVLEARACGIPVLSTDFGSLKKHIGDDNHSIFYSEPRNFVNSVATIKSLNNRDFTKSNIENFNREFFDIIEDEIES